MIAIVDYGMGNLESVKKAAQYLGVHTKIVCAAGDLYRCEKIIFPGVGAFGDAVLELGRRKLIDPIKKMLCQEVPFLGICLGMQVLFEASEESPGIEGLGVITGKVKRFQGKIKIPHIGWNQLTFMPKNRCPLLKSIPNNSFVYFCHSYYVAPMDKDIIAATTNYGKNFASVIWQDNIFGLQFHPEKSQKVGLKILENFIKL